MSYPEDLQVPENLQNLLRRKEFAQLRLNKNASEYPRPLNPNYLEESIFRERHLFTQPHQEFLHNFIGPDTMNDSVLVKYGMGLGKTISAIYSAMPFIQYYLLQHKLTEKAGISFTPSIFIIGFSKAIFQRELLRRPEFGFISREELIEHKRLQQLAESGSKADLDALAEFESRIKKRLSKKGRGGFFKFFGYKEFFNRLFIFNTESEESKKSTKSEEEVVEKEEDKDKEEEKEEEEKEEVDAFASEKSKEGEASKEDEAILEGLQNGSISLNMELVDMFANSMVICDEIQNAYNSMEVNNYGIALSIILNIYRSPAIMQKYVDFQGTTADGQDRTQVIRNSIVKLVLMSATPINNSPPEVIDLLNILIPWSRLPEQRRLRKEDFFLDQRDTKPHALKEIAKLVTGHILFLRDDNPKYFPEKIWEGEYIKIPPMLLGGRAKLYKKDVIPYVRFIRCPMSEFHQATYDVVMEEAITLPPDGQSLLDIAVPNPADPKIGIFKSRDIKYALSRADQKWKDKNSADYLAGVGITGEFLQLKNLRKYSTKDAQMVEDLQQNLREDRGKVIVNHQYVKMSGVMLLQEILRKNGFIDEFSAPTEGTLCSRCGLAAKVHNSRSDHEFIPARFVTIHGDMDKHAIETSLEKFKHPNNVDGYQYRVLIGSKIINVGMDFNAVRNVYVMTVPPNFSTLLQIIGRAVRKNSHLGLPPEKRQVYIRVYTSALRGANGKINNKDLSYEERRYFEKSQDYLVVQEIDKVFNEYAVDAVIHRDIIMPLATEKSAPARGLSEDDLGSKYFEPAPIFGRKLLEMSTRHKPFEKKDIDETTYFLHSDEEVNNIIYIIKRLFIEQSPIWTYGDLWKAVQNPPFDVPVNTQLFTSDNFQIALYAMTEDYHRRVDAYQILTEADEAYHRDFNRLFDSLDRRILIKGNDYCIVPMKEYYILFPVAPQDIMQNEEETEEEKSAPSHLGRSALQIVSVPDIDVDNWYRRTEPSGNTVLRITKFLRSFNASYDQMKYKFYTQFRDTPVSSLPTTVEVYDLDFHIHLLEDAIQYAFHILTNPEAPVSELHDFYFKMLYFYDRLELLLFAEDLEETKYEKYYAEYVTAGSIKLKGEILKEKERHKYNAFLMSSIGKSAGESLHMQRLQEFLGAQPQVAHKKHPKIEAIRLHIAKAKKIRKVFPNMLPVGHLLNNSEDTQYLYSYPKVYLPKEDKWIYLQDFAQQLTPLDEMVENDIIIGYYERAPGSIEVRFKVRPPVQKIVKHADTRMIESGSACSTKKKEELFDIAKSLKIKVEAGSIRNICTAIKLELMQREMQARRHYRHLSDKEKAKEKRVRWFYLHFEGQPEPAAQ